MQVKVLGMSDQRAVTFIALGLAALADTTAVTLLAFTAWGCAFAAPWVVAALEAWPPKPRRTA